MRTGNAKIQSVVSTLFLLAAAKVLNAFDNLSTKNGMATKVAKAFHNNDAENKISINDSGVQKSLGKPDHTKIRGSNLKPANAKMVSVPSFMKLRSNDRDRELQSCTICTYTIYDVNDCAGAEYMLDSSYAGFGNYSYSEGGTCYEKECCSTDPSDCCIIPECKICYEDYFWLSCPAGYEKIYSMWDTYYTYADRCDGPDRCCETNLYDCCSKISTTTDQPVPVPAPISVPVPAPAPFLDPAPVPVPAQVPVLVPAPVSQPTVSKSTNPAVFIAIGVVVPVIIGLVIAIVCLLRRKK
jgi:hypothetical protein